MSKDKFVDVPSLGGRISVSKDGKIYSNISNKLLKTTVSKNGYEEIVIQFKNPRRCRTFLVHRLVAETFIPNPENKPQVNHKDGNKLNNNVNNLEWCTQKYNNMHAISNGFLVKNINGILQNNVNNRKLTIEQVRIIRQNSHLKTKSLCELLNIDYNEYKHSVYDVIRGRSFKNEY